MYYSPKTNGLKHNSCCQLTTHCSQLKQPSRVPLSQFDFLVAWSFSLHAKPNVEVTGPEAWAPLNVILMSDCVLLCPFPLKSRVPRWRMTYLAFTSVTNSLQRRNTMTQQTFSPAFLHHLQHQQHFCAECTSLNTVTLPPRRSFLFAKHRISLLLRCFGNNNPYSFLLSFPLPAGLTVTWPLLFHQQVSAQFPVLWHGSVIWLGCTHPLEHIHLSPTWSEHFFLTGSQTLTVLPFLEIAWSRKEWDWRTKLSLELDTSTISASWLFASCAYFQ